MRNGDASSAASSMWRSLEVMGGIADGEGVRDLARYLLSREPGTWDEFRTAWTLAVDALMSSPAAVGFRREGRTLDGVPCSNLSDPELRLNMESLMLGTRGFYDRMVIGGVEAFPHPMRYDEFLLEAVRLFEALDAVKSSVAEEVRGLPEPMWAEHRGDRTRDGAPWIELAFGSGGDAPDRLDLVNSTSFQFRLHRAFWKAAFSEEFRSLRRTSRLRKVDVTITYWTPGEEPERVSVERQRSRLDLAVDRDTTHLDEHVDPASAAATESELLLNHARAALANA